MDTKGRLASQTGQKTLVRVRWKKVRFMDEEYAPLFTN